MEGHLLNNKVLVIGAMSGTSLDGLDLAACEFELIGGRWIFNIVEAETLPYSGEWINNLKNGQTFTGEEFLLLHNLYGKYLGKKIAEFLSKYKLSPQLIASHGHTLFHQPEKAFTFQIGNGAEIFAETGIQVVADFRTTDVALGGQGAPLVPVGDRLLFADYDYCLNLGGFANVSYDDAGRRIAFDNCPINFVLNVFANKKGLPFDNSGDLGRSGQLNKSLLTQLNQLDYYKMEAPKSLGREWVENTFNRVVGSYSISDIDKMRTVYEHAAIQIAKVFTPQSKVLITGGGAFNTFLIERIAYYSKAELVIPENKLINFKEALIFAFLGMLRSRGEINCLASVTGAKRDSSSGIIFG